MGRFRTVRGRDGPRRGRRRRDHRLVLDGVLWIARTSTAWRGLSSHFGEWNSVYLQFRRWTLAGVWDVMLAALNEIGGTGHDSVQMIDSTIIRAHQHAASALQVGISTRVLAAVAGLFDQGPSPQQRSGSPCRRHAQRRSGFRRERQRPRHGRAWARASRPARRQGIRRRLHPGR